MGTQSFLPASLQGTISSRGGRHIDSLMNDNGRMTSHGFVQDDENTRDPHGKGDILGKGEMLCIDPPLIGYVCLSGLKGKKPKSIKSQSVYREIFDIIRYFLIFDIY